VASGGLRSWLQGGRNNSLVRAARMAREILVVQKLTETESLKVIETQLQKGLRRGKTEENEAEQADIEKAA
jgi:hypothetical protein